MRAAFFLFLAFSVAISAREEINPWNLLPTARIWNRKQISYFIAEKRPDHFRLSLLVCERFPYNYKSQSSAFYFVRENEEEILDLQKKLGEHLERGEEITVRLRGSEIIELVFGTPE